MFHTVKKVQQSSCGSVFIVYSENMSEQREQSVTVAVRLPEDVAAKLDEIARRNYASRSGILRMAVDALLESREKDGGELSGDEASRAA